MADFYVQAGRALQDILARRGSIKAITAKVGEGKDDARAAGNAKRILALVVNTLSFRTTLQIILAKVDIAAREPKWFGPASPLNRTKGALPPPAPTLASCILLVLVHDLLFASRGIQAAKAWPPRERLERHRSQLHAELVRIQLRMGKSHPEELRSGAEERRIAARIPRWCRVNTLRATPVDVIQALTEQGWTLEETDTIEKEYVGRLTQICVCPVAPCGPCFRVPSPGDDASDANGAVQERHADLAGPSKLLPRGGAQPVARWGHRSDGDGRDVCAREQDEPPKCADAGPWIGA